MDNPMILLKDGSQIKCRWIAKKDYGLVIQRECRDEIKDTIPWRRVQSVAEPIKQKRTVDYPSSEDDD